MNRTLFITCTIMMFSLAACQTEKSQLEQTTIGHAEAPMGMENHAMKTLPVEKRVAFMSGHVQAGMALYKAGAPDQAAKHLLHPVSETHEAERAGIDALGFDQSIFIEVSKALEDGKAASEIEPQLNAAKANMALMQKNAGGDHIEIIEFLMDTVIEEYAIGVTDGVITDPGEYQDAYGFTVVALSIAERMQNSSKLQKSLSGLLSMWPENGPLKDSTPASVRDITEAVAQVREPLRQSR